MRPPVFALPMPRSTLRQPLVGSIYPHTANRYVFKSMSLDSGRTFLMNSILSNQLDVPVSYEHASRFPTLKRED